MLNSDAAALESTLPLEDSSTRSPNPGPNPQPRSQPSPSKVRIDYLDNLRAIAMTLGVFLHAGLAYADPAQSIWIATDPRSSVVIDASIWLIHLFRMALFFLISGYFAKLIVQRKGVKAFLWNRTLRLVFPFALFYPFLLAAMTICFIFALSYIENPKGLMGIVSKAIKEGGAESNAQPWSTMHLWFLYYLVLFSLISALLVQIGWPKWPKIRIAKGWMVLAPLALVPGVIGGGFPMAAPESFIPLWWPIAFYGLFYACGWWLFDRESNIDGLSRYWIAMALGIGLGYGLFYHMMPVISLEQVSPLSFQRKVLLGFLGAYLSAGMVWFSLWAGRRFLDWRSWYLRLLSDASYWVYLVHLPIVLMIQTFLIPLDWNVWVKLGMTIVGAMSACMITYIVLVRYTPLGWLLNGKRSFP